MKKTQLILASVSLLLAGAVMAQAQTGTSPTSSYHAGDDFGPRSGDWEFTLGGSGASNKAINNSLGGVNLSVGRFLTDSLELAVRQSGNYSNGTGSGGVKYDGSTFVALDQHFGSGCLHPFVGVNFGGLYGDSTPDSWGAGIEGGLKFYVKPKTFLFALANYTWTFDHAKDVTDNFDNGAFVWSVGVGFNF
jgi:hypothetical protein